MNSFSYCTPRLTKSTSMSGGSLKNMQQNSIGTEHQPSFKVYLFRFYMINCASQELGYTYLVNRILPIPNKYSYKRPLYSSQKSHTVPIESKKTQFTPALHLPQWMAKQMGLVPYWKCWDFTAIWTIVGGGALIFYIYFEPSPLIQITALEHERERGSLLAYHLWNHIGV